MWLAVAGSGDIKVAGRIRCVAGYSRRWLAVTAHRPNGEGQGVRADVVVAWSGAEACDGWQSQAMAGCSRQWLAVAGSLHARLHVAGCLAGCSSRKRKRAEFIKAIAITKH